MSSKYIQSEVRIFWLLSDGCFRGDQERILYQCGFDVRRYDALFLALDLSILTRISLSQSALAFNFAYFAATVRSAELH